MGRFGAAVGLAHALRTDDVGGQPVRQLGAALAWMMNLSPFTHLPKLPGADVSPAPYVWLLALAGALTAAGLAGFRRRDLG